MKGVVAFDSFHGSTKTVAEAIAEQLKALGHDVQLINLRESVPTGTSGDFLLVGSPTRGGKPSKETTTFVDGLDASWKGKPIGVFDTLGPLSKDAAKRKQTIENISTSWGKNAASRLAEQCGGKGLNVVATGHFPVTGMWGPLAPEGPEMAKEFARKFAANLK
ncbi:MAG TPA: flavodoxin domain-containing protein [Methanomassiliicoccales archaeon]|jgi:flavodoxin|nr:flavodoxin domain-containing protein [Methanomassiliicoccales archaeon]